MTDPFLFNTSLKNIGLLFLGTAIYENLGHFFEAKVVILQKVNRYLNKSLELRIPCREQGKKLAMRSFVILGIIALPIGCMVTSRMNMPQSYYVSHMDNLGEDIVVRSEVVTDEILQDHSVKVYNYLGAGNSMWHIDSERIRRIEYMRRLVGVTLGIFLVEWGIVRFFEMLGMKSANPVRE